jgi:hypothetical protein
MFFKRLLFDERRSSILALALLASLPMVQGEWGPAQVSRKAGILSSLQLKDVFQAKSTTKLCGNAVSGLD